MSGRKPLSRRTVDRALRARGWTYDGPEDGSARSGSWLINPEHAGQRLFARYDGLQFVVSDGRLHDAERGLFAPNVHIVSYWAFASTAELSAALDSIELLDESTCLRCEAKDERNAPRLEEIKCELDALKAKYPEAWKVVEQRWGVR